MNDIINLNQFDSVLHHLIFLTQVWTKIGPYFTIKTPTEGKKPSTDEHLLGISGIYSFILVAFFCISTDDKIMHRLSELFKPNICIVVYSSFRAEFKLIGQNLSTPKPLSGDLLVSVLKNSPAKV